jgi:hypothetical protein
VAMMPYPDIDRATECMPFLQTKQDGCIGMNCIAITRRSL